MAATDTSNNWFKHAGAKYLFIAKLQNNNNSDAPKDSQSPVIQTVLNNDDIKLFEYVSELNQLYLTGSLVYVDTTGQVDKYIEMNSVFCDISFIQYEDLGDGQIDPQKMSNTNKMQHLFLVKSIEILDRQQSIITYKLNLVSAIWLKLVSNISYSNYDIGPQSVLDIVKLVLTNSDLSIDKDSFDKVKTSVKINYITNGNDNVMTCFDYLMHKLYYYNDKDDSMKFIAFDESKNQYKMFNLVDPMLRSGNLVVMLSFFKTTNETQVHSESNKLATVVKFPKTDMFKSQFNINIVDYDYTMNTFVTKTTLYNQITNFQNQNIGLDNTYAKYQPMVDDMPLHPNNKYLRNGSYWNNNIDVYHDTVMTFLKDNSLVINTDGKLDTHTTTYVNVAIDRTVGMTNDIEDKDQLEQMKNKYKSFEGTWIVSKVRSSVLPAEHVFRQNLVLFRNFMFKQDSSIKVDIS